jgi:hypothetical protein
MSQQYSITSLQQQINQLHTLRSDQLNGLLQRLESYKTRFPIEDHPIINWGIGLVEAKIREEEKLMSEEIGNDEILIKYKDYETFMQATQWHVLDLTNQINRGKLLHEGSKELCALAALNKTYEGYRILADWVPLFKQYLYKLLAEKKQESRYKNFILEYKKAFQVRTDEARCDRSPMASHFAQLVDFL